MSSPAEFLAPQSDKIVEKGFEMSSSTLFLIFAVVMLGSLIFGELLFLGLNTALALFAVIELALALAAVWLFRAEGPAGSAGPRP